MPFFVLNNCYQENKYYKHVRLNTSEYLLRKVWKKNGRKRWFLCLIPNLPPGIVLEISFFFHYSLWFSTTNVLLKMTSACSGYTEKFHICTIPLNKWCKYATCPQIIYGPTMFSCNVFFTYQLLVLVYSYRHYLIIWYVYEIMFQTEVMCFCEVYRWRR